MVKRLALIGRGISHSRSPELYRRLIGPGLDYDLLDYQSEEEIPSIAELASRYQGLNITAPWKKVFFPHALPEERRWGAVNCVSFTSGSPRAINTDARALRELIPQMQKEYQAMSWVIFGDGVMSGVLQELLREFSLKVDVYSRRKGDQLTQFNLLERHPKQGVGIVINTCSRDFSYQGSLDSSWVFWDLNYAHRFHENTLPERCLRYVDGMSLLEGQAKYAVKFWKLGC